MERTYYEREGCAAKQDKGQERPRVVYGGPGHGSNSISLQAESMRQNTVPCWTISGMRDLYTSSRAQSGIQPSSTSLVAWS
jgi:hypothetical protein